MRKLFAALLVMFATLPAFCQEVFFSPRGGAQAAVISALNGAQTEVRVATYVLTSTNIANALKAAKARGVDVSVIADDSMNAAKCCARDVALTVPLVYDYSHAIMHDKYIIVDRQIVITGSYNLSGAAETSNAENLIVLRDEILARKYLADWAKHKAHSR